MSNEQLQLFDPDKVVKKRYPTVSTAEKRRLLEEVGEPWPVCDCCGIEKDWNARTIKAGGSWGLKCTSLKKDKRNTRTPGTYLYNRNHGIGMAGYVRQKAQWRRLRTPGTYRHDANIARIEQRMQKYIEGTPENIEYKERLRQQWM